MTLTVLRHPSRPLTKTWRADGTIASYGETKNYRVEQVAVENIGGLSAALTKIERDPNAAVIRGTPNGNPDSEAAVGMVRKISASFDDVALPWVLIEVDAFKPSVDPVLDPVAAIDEFIAATLPPAFADVSFHWQLSSSAGHQKNAGVLKVHLWFWLSAPATSAQLKAWAQSLALPIDTSVLNAVQLHFTAAPLFEPGVFDPVPKRSGFVRGLFDDSVDLELPSGSTQVALRPAADDFSDLLAEPTLGWTINEARAVLMDCDADADRETWLRVLMALHHEFGGSAEALDLADDWSQLGASYGGRDDVEGRWKSFGRGTGTISGKWLLKHRGECRARQRHTAVDEWKSKIGASVSDFDLREKVCVDIMKDTRLGEIERESLSQVLQGAFKSLGTKLPIATVRGLVTPFKKLTENDRGWCQGWVWVTDEDRFFRLDSDEWLTKTSFDAKFNRLMPRDPATGVVVRSASDVALEDAQIHVATRAHYLPWAPAMFRHQGNECVNRYRPSSVPVAVEKLSDKGRAAVAAVERHLNAICGGRADVVQQLTSWLAYCVQNPGRKIRWAPVIQGIQGDGKSRIGDLAAAVMGRANVKTVSPKVIGTDFTGWGEGSCVAIFEEVKISGQNKNDVMNSIKTFITNDVVHVHRKGKDGYDTDNVTNFIAVTNYRDALPLDDDDRRFFVIFTPWNSLAEMAGVLGMSTEDHFEELTQALYTQPAELRRWLLDYKIPGSFKVHKAPPMTAEKLQMIALNMSDDESDVRELLANGADGVGQLALSSSSLVAALSLSGSASELVGWKVNKMLTKLGWVKVEKKLKWRGSSHRVWVKNSQVDIDPDNLRKILDSTLQKNAEKAESAF